MRSPDAQWSYMVGPMVAPLVHILWHGMVSGLWGGGGGGVSAILGKGYGI